MANGFIKVGETQEGKYYGQIRRYNGVNEKTYYETPEYVTREMAYADAACWRAFHMTDVTPTTPNYDINVEDTVRTARSRNGVPNSTWTGSEFAQKLIEWRIKFPEMTMRCGREDGNGHKTKGDDFFICIRKLPDARESWYIVKKP